MCSHMVIAWVMWVQSRLVGRSGVSLRFPLHSSGLSSVNTMPTLFVWSSCLCASINQEVCSHLCSTVFFVESHTHTVQYMQLLIMLKHKEEQDCYACFQSVIFIVTGWPSAFTPVPEPLFLTDREDFLTGIFLSQDGPFHKQYAIIMCPVIQMIPITDNQLL